MSQPLLGRCKECDYTLFSTEEDVQPAETFADVKQIGVVYLMDGIYFARCENRHKVFVLNHIKGTYSADHNCDARCLSARGNDCTCSCGGANHGRGHVAVHHEAVAAREERFLGEVGEFIRGEAKVVSKRLLEAQESTLYNFMTPDQTAKITWFAPDYANPDYEVGQVIKFRAKVKRHEDHERFGKATIVTYLEEVA